MRAAIYARVSSAAQRDKHTIENQLRVLPTYAREQRWTIFDTYADDGRSAKSGMLERRDEFARLMRDAEARRFDVVLVIDVDRLTRTDSIEERAQILGPFQRLGIQIATPSGGMLDLRSFLGEFWVTVQALVAAEENRKRASRISAGKLRAIAEGRKPAGPTPFGWTYTRETGEWSIDEPAAAILREIFRRVAAGDSCVQVADDLIRRDASPAPRTGWSRAAVYRIVRKRTALGEWEADKARRGVIHVPPIITEDDWQAASRALLAHKRRGLRRTKHIYLLEGLARCGHCGAPIAIRSATTNPKRTNGNPSPAAYVCRARKLERACTAPIAKCAELDARVWSALCVELEEPDIIRALADVDRDRALGADAAQWQKDADGYRAHLARLEKVEAGIMVRYRRGAISDAVVDAELAAIGRERKMLRDQLGTAERAIGASLSAQERQRAAAATVERLRAALPKATPEQRRALLRELIDDERVILKNGRARVALRVPREEAATSRGDVGAVPSLVDTRSYRKQHGAILRIRVVA